MAGRPACPMLLRLLLPAAVVIFGPPRRVVAQDHSCELASLFEHLTELQEGCCDGEACEPTGYPDEDDACDRTCGEIFEPFWDDCGEMLNRMRVDGQCIDECTPAMMHCRLMEVQSACCSDARNCPDSSPVPHRCSVQCALVFPTMVDSCAEELESGGLDMDEYRSFADRCMRQDGTALVEYAHDLVRQGCEIDLVSPQDRGRRAQDNEGSAQKTGIAKMLQTNENTCSWQSFDDRVVEMSAVCCGTNADEVCADGQPPRQCSPECAVYFHSFYSDCETLLSTIQQDDMDKFTDFEATCMDEADASFFLTAIKHATCCSRSNCQGCHDQESCMATSLETTEDSATPCMWVATTETCEVRPPSSWVQIGTNVCYGPGNNAFGTFTNTLYAGPIARWRLTRISGSLCCGCGCGLTDNVFWGCECGWDQDGIYTMVTNDAGEIYFPRDDTPGITILPVSTTVWIPENMAGNRNQYQTTIEIEAAPSANTIELGQMHLYYSEDYLDRSESDNRGQVCADIFVYTV